MNASSALEIRDIIANDLAEALSELSIVPSRMIMHEFEINFFEQRSIKMLRCTWACTAQLVSFSFEGEKLRLAR
jgi:hypothetical protein